MTKFKLIIVLGECDFKNLPANIWKVVQSVDQLTPDSLSGVHSSNESSEFVSFNNSVEQFMRGGEIGGDAAGQSNQQFKYMIFVWDGTESSSLVKASTIAKAIELEGLLQKARDSVLKVLFSGGVVRGKKLQRGSVYVFGDEVERQRTSETQIVGNIH